jgi:hypothetical protein
LVFSGLGENTLIYGNGLILNGFEEGRKKDRRREEEGSFLTSESVN